MATGKQLKAARRPPKIEAAKMADYDAIIRVASLWLARKLDDEPGFALPGIDANNVPLVLVAAKLMEGKRYSVNADNPDTAERCRLLARLLSSQESGQFRGREAKCHFSRGNGIPRGEYRVSQISSANDTISTSGHLFRHDDATLSATAKQVLEQPQSASQQLEEWVMSTVVA